MIVIVEGIDRVGKTTLCEKLQERGFVILKDGIDFLKDYKATKSEASLASASKIDTTFRFILQLHHQGVNVVVDRCHLTEIVYGVCTRKNCDSDLVREFEEGFAAVAGADALLVLVEPTNVDEACERAQEDLRAHDRAFKKVYSNSAMFKMRTSFNELDSTVDFIMKRSGASVSYDFYLASPFFRPDQVEREERIKEKLRSLGYKVFSPKEACFLQSDAEISSQEAVFKANCDAIKDATAVFAITDTKDMGTIWEAGYAYGIKKPVIYFAETLGDNQFNLMLAQSGNMVLLSGDEVSRDNIDSILNNPHKRIPYGGAIE